METPVDQRLALFQALQSAQRARVSADEAYWLALIKATHALRDEMKARDEYDNFKLGGLNGNV
jgi:hypothetical protein